VSRWLILAWCVFEIRLDVELDGCYLCREFRSPRENLVGIQEVCGVIVRLLRGNVGGKNKLRNSHGLLLLRATLVSGPSGVSSTWRAALFLQRGTILHVGDQRKN
jgi:hypothetical protein